MKHFLPLIILLTPLPTHAAVVISEVAWMGGSVSANHEWIELHNTGNDVDVTGWTLTDGNNLTIPLTGVISANSYVVLERTSDDSAPGTAFLVYTGALPNTGATLTLRRADASIEDQVAGGTDWSQIGGDNVSKHTAQYSSAGWVTAAPTAGMTNATQATTAPTTTAPSVSTPTQTSSNSGGSKLATPTARPAIVRTLTVPNDTLQLSIEGPSIGYVNQSLNFLVTPSGLGKTLLQSVSYGWNPGDGTSRGGSEKHFTHTFTHPGRYIVSVYGSFVRHNAEARHEITILPITVSLTKNAASDVQINNDSPYEIALEGYTLHGERTVTFAPRTYLLPEQTITIPAARLGATHTVTLRDATAAVIAVFGLTQTTSPPTSAPVYVQQSTQYVVPPSQTTPRALPTASAAEEMFRFATTSSSASVILDSLSAVTTTVPLSSNQNTAHTNWWPYLGLGVLILAAAGLLLVQPNRTRSSNMHE